MNRLGDPPPETAAAVSVRKTREVSGAQDAPIRACTPDHFPAIMALAAANPLPGEPAHAPQHDLGEVFTFCDEQGQVRGAMCLSARHGDRLGIIHWLHDGEDFTIATALLDYARTHLSHRPTLAFTSPATTAGVPGLPVRHRQATARAVATTGFTPTAAQDYFLCPLAPDPVADPDPIAEVTPLSTIPGWQLKVKKGSGTLGSAVVLRPHPMTATAVLWHLAVHPEHRRRGVGSRLLAQCLRLASNEGARQMAAYADPGDEPVSHMLLAQDFDPIDTFSVYQRRC
ncbi:hypothetical protein SSP24_83120 [Streptomyces spinoverrucosus]|uniref:N-acetyltransferase domain-containing protein n=1 Tax=Streptomyces spinoverrucosus TaxID=284043 RepID=A0A4Y3VUV8_9ACTN|nr:GNAT family N-acetyltransferase [Streptomyces spinoverrucosus]GEC10657.1 hypothetical protein SSP24_83120 [Streptomyces spinoverrucosus]GHB99187.1 hypothetical protein GCM10010397_84340 [Streptomyces spinoverrucosus]